MLQPEIGDLVRINAAHGGREWPEAQGQIGTMVDHARRLYIPAAKVLVLGEVVEFDLDELEVIK